MGPAAARLEGGRIHLQHGPIDLVIHAAGDADAVERAHRDAWARFREILPALVRELPALRRAIDPAIACDLTGPIARRMWSACRPFAQGFITPMAAVAGSVADEIVAFYRLPGIARASVNNGGDIALHMQLHETMRIAIVPDVTQPDAAHDPARRLDVVLEGTSRVRGIATSGWHGRSFSLGIADSVTTFAATAAEADAAATIVANAVDLDHPGIVRRPACDLQPDSDLGERLVTVSVSRLPTSAVRAALDAGEAKAMELLAKGRIAAAVLVCQGQVRRVGAPTGLVDPARRALNPN